jgi:hypothetical protein
MKHFDEFNNPFPRGLGALAREFSAYEQAQKTISQSLGAFNAVESEIERYKSLQVAAQAHAIEQQRWDSIRNILDPMEQFRKGLAVDTGWRKVLDELSQPKSAMELITESSGVSSFLKNLRDSSSGLSALEHARETYATADIANSILRQHRAFHEAQRSWELPHQLVDSVGALAALQEQIGRLTLPVMDWNSAATLARVLGRDGLQAELAALGIGENGEFISDVTPASDGGFLTPKQRDLLTILSLILALLVPVYQEWSSTQSKATTDNKPDSHTVMLETQARQLESLSILVERALIKESARADTRFVVLDRVATVRTRPHPGSSVEGKLLPREVVTLVSEQGKWIEVRYFHWVVKEYQTGWVLKKYFTRVPSSQKYEK